jgi:hypothetical protein
MVIYQILMNFLNYLSYFYNREDSSKNARLSETGLRRVLGRRSLHSSFTMKDAQSGYEDALPYASNSVERRASIPTSNVKYLKKVANATLQQ